jgi:RNA polymerase sigma factor (sigma-70 family)
MLTLKGLKGQLGDMEFEGKLPSSKALLEGDMEILVEKSFKGDAGKTRIVVYVNGLVVYQIEQRATVFHINMEKEYQYSTVSETGLPDGGIVQESFFDNQEWYLLLMLIGEDRLEHNLFGRDAGRCVSYSCVAEDWECLEDDSQEEIIEHISAREQVKEMLGVLNKKQKYVLEQMYLNEKTCSEIASDLGIKSKSSVSDMHVRALKKIKKNFHLDGERKKDGKNKK